MALSFQPIRPLLKSGSGIASRLLSYLGLGIGVLLLLCSVQMFGNIRQMLSGNLIRKNGYDFISITRRVTNETMGQPGKNVIRAEEINELRAQPFIAGAAPLVANEFHVSLSIPGLIESGLFLESLDPEYIDTVPASFTWQPGEPILPLILSSDFLESYNIYAPSQGLPQVSRESAMRIPIVVVCSGRGQNIPFQASIVGFSDRINSILAPASFMDWANSHLGEIKKPGASRVFLKTTDANNPQLLRYLDSKQYSVNREKTKFGREKGILQGIVSGLGLVGLLVVVLALLLFSFYVQLLIARSRESLHLLLLLGYSPKWLGRRVSLQFIPAYVLIVLAALLGTQIIQSLFYHAYLKTFDRSELSPWLSVSVLAVALALLLLAIWANGRLVARALRRL